MDAFFKAIEASAEEYMNIYKADLDSRRAEKEQLEEERRQESMEKLRKDKEGSHGETVILSTGLKDKEGSLAAMMEDLEEEIEDADEEEYENKDGDGDEDEDEDEDEEDEEDEDDFGHDLGKYSQFNL